MFPFELQHLYHRAKTRNFKTMATPTTMRVFCSIKISLKGLVGSSLVKRTLLIKAMAHRTIAVCKSR